MARKRQEAVHQATLQEIKDTARALMAETGTAGLSIRGIAKVMELTPPAIYNYFASLDDLITALITDNFNALADALETARDNQNGNAVKKLLAVLLAYRQWAVDHPVDFQLNYGNPIPGYIAPGEITVPAVVRSFAVTVGLIEEIFQQGLAVPTPPYDQVPTRAETTIRDMIERDGYPISPLSMYLGVIGWGQLHGVIMLEIFNHIQAIVGDTEAHYVQQVHNLLRGMGVRL